MTNGDERLSDVQFVILDTETTGLSPFTGDRICEIALVRTCRGRVLDTFDSLINPLVPISPAAEAVHGISDYMLEDAYLFREVADRVIELLSGAVMVAHNARFDMGFLSAQLTLLGLSFPDIPVIDTLALARRNFDFARNTLESVAENLGVKHEKAHRAMADVAITRAVFEKMVESLGGWDTLTLAGLLELQGGAAFRQAELDVVLPPEIEDAIHNQKDLEIRYVSSQGRMTERVIRPLEIIAAADSVMMVAFCYMRNAKRTFRIDRIIDMKRALD
jgi:DNA polymerase-3 subunit epsilon